MSSRSLARGRRAGGLEAVRITPLSETDWIIPEPPAAPPPPPRSPAVTAGTSGVVLSLAG